MNECNSALKDLNAAIRIYLDNKNVLMPNMLTVESARAFYMRGNVKEILKFKKIDIIINFTNSIQILQELIDNNSDDFQAYSLLCNCLLRRGDNNEGHSINQAEADYSRSISIGEKFIKSKGNMPQITLSLVRGLYLRHDIYIKMGEITKAKSDLFRAAVLARKVHELKNIRKEESLIGNILASYSSALIDIGRSKEVFLECKYFLDYLKTKRGKVDKLAHAKIYNNVGHALTLNGKPNNAIELFDLAIEIYSKHEEKDKEKSEPLLAGSINNRGNAKYTSGRFDSALNDYNFSIGIAKNLYSKDQTDDNKFLFARSLVSKAWLLSTCPDNSYREPSNALGIATKACEIMKWGDIDCLYTYAAACAENNDFIKACSWQRKAIIMSSSEPERAFLKMILFYYENNKPYRAQTT